MQSAAVTYVMAAFVFGGAGQSGSLYAVARTVTRPTRPVAAHSSPPSAPRCLPPAFHVIDEREQRP